MRGYVVVKVCVCCVLCEKCVVRSVLCVVWACGQRLRRSLSSDGKLLRTFNFFKHLRFDLYRYLTRNVGVTTIPPSAFYSPEHKHEAEQYTRFAFCKRDEVIIIWTHWSKNYEYRPTPFKWHPPFREPERASLQYYRWYHNEKSGARNQTCSRNRGFEKSWFQKMSPRMNVPANEWCVN